MTADPGRTAADREVPLGGGRVMLLREYGDPRGVPVIALHGTPASRLMYAGATTAGALGLRIIAPDRWGYGGTTAHPDPALPAFAADIARLADVLGIARFAVLGVSGGGPYSCALAALLPDRVTTLALVAPVGPIGGMEGVKLTPFHHFCFRILPRMPGGVALVFRAYRRGVRSIPNMAVRIAALRSPPADLRILDNKQACGRFIAMSVEGLRPGVEGAITDMRIFNRPWDLPLGAISAPSRLWIGTADANVPIDAAMKLAAVIPGCELVELRDEGHLWVAMNYDTVLRWIAETQKGAVKTAPAATR